MAHTPKDPGPFEVVSVNDEAIDRGSPAGAAAVRRFEKHRDAAKLVTLPGAELTRYVCQPLSRRALAFLSSLPTEKIRNQWAFRIAVTGIINGPHLSTEREDGGWEPSGRCIPDPTMDRLAAELGTDILEEVGATAYQRATLSGPLGGRYQLPPGYRVNLEAPSSVGSPTSTTTSANSSNSPGGQSGS